MSNLVAMQITAIATAVLAALALATAVTASLALRRQSEQVRVLREDHKREVTERRQAQASAVFMREDRPIALPSSAGSGTGGVPIKAKVRNDSNRPIYDLYFIWHLGRKILYTDLRDRKLMPGEEAKAEKDAPRGLGQDARRDFGPAVIFRDTAGVGWLRKPDGYLGEITADEAEGLLSKTAPLGS